MTAVTYPMTDEDREIQEKARKFVDEELIPHEVEAEMNGGEIDSATKKRHKELAQELGLFAMNMPRSLGGTEMTMFQQTLVSEQIGRVTNALGWVVHTPPAWAPDVVSKEQLDRWIAPTVRGELSECYAITEEGAGSDVDAIESTARKEGDDYVLNGRKLHVTSFNQADYLFFQAKLVGGAHEGEHAMFFVDIPTDGLEVVRIPKYMHTYEDVHALLQFNDVRVPSANLVGEEGGGMAYTY
ncbi:MAG: acyl-CoA dehydrogenase family protein [Actinomycetota bacterium]